MGSRDGVVEVKGWGSQGSSGGQGMWVVGVKGWGDGRWYGQGGGVVVGKGVVG